MVQKPGGSPAPHMGMGSLKKPGSTPSRPLSCPRGRTVLPKQPGFLPVLLPQGWVLTGGQSFCPGFQKPVGKRLGSLGRECLVPPGTPKVQRVPREKSRLRGPWAL